MKIVRFSAAGQVSYGVLENGLVRGLSGSPYEHLVFSGNTYNLKDLKLLAPCEPSKVVCVGLNYQAHIEEFKRDRSGIPDEPVLFLKPPTSVVGPGDPIVLPAMSSQVDYEAEMAVVIGRQASHLEPGEAAAAVCGFTCANDVTARDLQKIDGQWTRAKAFDTFCPLGPWIETELDPADLRISLEQNGEIKQDSTTSCMIFPVMQLVSFVSQVMTLLPGDVILTGTPSGIGPMKLGDTVKVVVQGIGELTNHVVRNVSKR